MADAVPLDLLKTEQERISREIGQVQTLLARAEADFGDVMDTFDQAAALLSNFDEPTYWTLPPVSRRSRQPDYLSAHPGSPGP